MTKCSFCMRETLPHLGVHLIRNDGTIQYYCSSKCRKNALKLKRDRKKLKWTEAYRIARAEESATEAAAAKETRKSEKATQEKAPEHKKEEKAEKKEKK